MSQLNEFVFRQSCNFGVIYIYFLLKQMLLIGYYDWVAWKCEWNKIRHFSE